MTFPRVLLDMKRLSLVGSVLLALSCAHESGRGGPASSSAQQSPESATEPVAVVAPSAAMLSSTPVVIRATGAPLGAQTPAVVPRPRMPRPDEDVIPAVESVAGVDGKFRRERLVRREFHYPLIRIEEVVQRTATGEQVVQRVEMVADHVLVSAAPGIDHLAMEKVAARHGVQVRSRVPGTKNYLLTFAADDHQSLARAKTALTGDPALRVVEPDYVVHHMVTPDDPQFGQLWGLDNQGQTGGTADADIDAPEAWQLGTGSHSVRVGVIDTGIDYTHPDLAANIWTNPGEAGTDGSGNDKRTNGVDDDANGFVDDWHGWDFVNNDNDPMDDHYHGTHCAGTIGAVGGNGSGIAGVCWEISLVGLKFLDAGGSGTTSAAIAAVTYANQLGLDLTSNSWGGGGYSQALKDAIDAAGVQGKLFVVAAGNSSGDNDVSPVYPASYTSDNLIAVAATSSSDTMAYFSCYGATSVDLGAPGVDIYSTKPGNTYGLLSGTSMATPHVAGACAFLKAINPGLTGAQIKTTLLTYSDPIPALQGKVLSNGRLNLAAAAVSVSGPHLIAEATVLSDIPVVDGIISPGETVLVSVTLRNSGSDTASGVTAALTSADGFLSIVQPSVQYGTVAAGAQAAPAQPAVVVVSSPLTTPQVATLALVVNGQDPDGDAHTWTIPVSFTIATAATISGQVVRTTGGAPVAGASVTFSGPSAGTVTTAADGSFSRVVMDGTHTLVAFAADLSPSAPQVVTTPPGATNVVFSLGAPDLTVDPTALTVVVGQGETATSQFAIGNIGDQPLHADLLVQSGVWQTTGLWHRSSWRDHGVGQAWYYGSETTHSYNTGSRNTGNLTSVSVNVPAGAPVLSFWSWRMTEPGLTWDRSLVQVSVEGSSVWSTLLQMSDVSGTWQHHDLDLLAYAGQTVQIRFSFDTIDSLYNDFEGWYTDEVVINGVPVDGWMVLGDDTVDVAPAGQHSVSVTVNPGVREPGSYTQDVLITSNDPDEPQTLLPVTMVVEGRPSLVYGNTYGHDDGQQFGIGDGDDAIEPGESILFWPGVRNEGGAPAVDVTAVLSTSDPYINLPSAAASYGTIVAGDILFGSGFLIEVAANCPLDHQVQFTLVVQDASNRQWTLSPTITVVSRSRVSGVISDLATGAPIGGATVSSSSFTTVTASDGTYLLNGLPPGTWTVIVAASGYTEQSTAVTLPGDAIWNVALGFPVLEVSPPALSAVVQYGDSVTHQLTIANPGSEPLTWSASFPYDASDYLIDTSDQTGGPAYVWNDIRTTGTAITGFYDDSNLGPFPLGFSFPFYDGTTTTMRICSNGWLSPTSSSAQYSTYHLPSPYAPAPLIAFYWRDLYFYSGATAHYQQIDAGTFVLQFTNVGLYGSSTTLLTCQTVLKIDGSITMYYQQVDDPTYGTVGIQNATATLGSTATYNQPFLHNNLAVRFRPATAGITITPSAGTVAAGDSATVAVTVDSLLRGIGLHEDVLTVTSNAPINGVVQVPVTTRVIFGSLPVVDPQQIATDEDVAVPVTLTGTDGDGDPLIFSVVSQPQHGTLSGSLPYLSYQPAANFFGSDSFTVVASDPYQDSFPEVISVTVVPVNDVPSARTLPLLTVVVGQPFSYAVPADLFSDVEDGTNLAFVVTAYDGQPLPARFTYDVGAHLLSGTATLADVGTLIFCFSYTDAGGAQTSTYVVPQVDVAPLLEGKLLASDGAAGHRFATAVDLDGRFAVVGSPFAGGRGQAYVFERQSGGWQQRQILVPSAVGDDDRFGCAVSIHDDVIVVASARPQGVRVSCFSLVADSWVAGQVLDLATAPMSTLPGAELDVTQAASLALSRDVLAVGTPFDHSGSLWLFERSGPTWTQTYRLSGGNEFQRLGWCVQVAGDRVVVGAPRADLGIPDAGAAIVLERSGGVWNGFSVITASQRQTGDAFGMSVDLDAETLAVGAPGDDTSTTDAGLVRLFRLQGGSWSEYALLGPGLPGFTGAQAFQGHVDQSVQSSYPNVVVVTPLRPGGPLFVLTANGSSGTFSSVPWQQGGGFAQAQNVTLGGCPASLVVTDLNGDGFTDALVADLYQHHICVLMGDGVGGFQFSGALSTGTNPFTVLLADLNHDGHDDLMTSNYGGTVSVLLGAGGGAFGTKVDYPTTGLCTYMAAGDLTGDGHLDLVVCNLATDTISVLLGNGDGTFQSYGAFAAGSSPQRVAIGDFDHDGASDVAVTNGGANTLSVLRGDGQGGFSAPTFYPTGNFGSSLRVVDLDRDGFDDLLLTAVNSGYFELLLNNRSGDFPTRLDYATGAGAYALTTSDLDGDGLLDVVTGNVDGTISAYLQQSGVTAFPGAYFGSAVALSATRILVGAPSDLPRSGGAVYGYLRANPTADPVRVLVHAPADASVGAGFGSAIAAQGDRLLVATPTDDDLGITSGSAYVLTMNANHAPMLVGTALTVSQDSSVQTTLAPLDADGDATALQVVSGPAHGTATLTGNVLRYVPQPGFTGSDEIQVVANDGSLVSAPAVVAITVTAYPEFYVLGFIQAEGGSGTTTRNLVGELNIPSSEPITITWATQDGNGFAGSDYLASSGTLVFPPGVTHLAIPIPVIGDTLVEHDEVVPILVSSTSPVILPITVPALIITNDDANTAPVIAEGASVSVESDEDNAPQAFALTLHASDADFGHVPEWQTMGGPLHGNVSLGAGPEVVVTYIPSADYHGIDSFQLRAVDGYGGEAVIDVTVTIRPRNDAPVVTTIPEITSLTVGKHSSVLHASTGTWNDDRDLAPGTITYAVQWQRAVDATGTGASDIAGATAWDYTTTSADRRRFLRVRVTATDNGEGEPTTASAEAVSDFVPEPSLGGSSDDGSSGKKCGAGGGLSAFALLILLSVMSLRRQRRR